MSTYNQQYHVETADGNIRSVCDCPASTFKLCIIDSELFCPRVRLIEITRNFSKFEDNCRNWRHAVPDCKDKNCFIRTHFQLWSTFMQHNFKLRLIGQCNTPVCNFYKLKIKICSLPPLCIKMPEQVRNRRKFG